MKVILEHASTFNFRQPSVYQWMVKCGRFGIEVVIVSDRDEFERILHDPEKFEKWLIDNTCDGPLKLMWEHEQKGIPPAKFPEMCRNCWKVLVFDISKEEALYIRKKFPHSKTLPMEKDPNKYLVVIYTKSEEERDYVRSELKIDNQVKGRIRYRFACRSFQDAFPDMFISTGKPNPKYL